LSASVDEASDPLLLGLLCGLEMGVQQRAAVSE